MTQSVFALRIQHSVKKREGPPARDHIMNSVFFVCKQNVHKLIKMTFVKKIQIFAHRKSMWVLKVLCG